MSATGRPTHSNPPPIRFAPPGTRALAQSPDWPTTRGRNWIQPPITSVRSPEAICSAIYGSTCAVIRYEAWRWLPPSVWWLASHGAPQATEPDYWEGMLDFPAMSGKLQP